MIVSEYIPAVWQAYRGKGSKAPAAGEDKWNNALIVTNSRLRSLAGDSNYQGDAYFDVRTITLSSSTTYDLDDDVLRLADEVYAIDVNGTQVNFKAVKKSQRNLFAKAVYITGSNPKVLNFNEAIPESLIGTTFYFGCYLEPEALTAASDDIIIENIDWLIYATAAELARNDPAKDDQYPNLQGIANDLYDDLIGSAQVNAYGQPNAAQVGYNQVGESW